MKKLLAGALAFSCGLSLSVTGQSIRAEFLSPPGVIRMTNDSLTKTYTNIVLDWQLVINGQLRQKGSVPGLTLLPHRPRTLNLPLRLPAGGEEACLQWQVHFPGLPGKTRAPLAARGLMIKRWGGDIGVPVAGELGLTDSNDLFTITAPALNAVFDKQTGWLRQFEFNHILLFADSNALRPILPGAPHLQLFSTSTGREMVIVRTEYTLPEQSCLLHLSYTLNAAGALLVEQTIESDTSRNDSVAHPLGSFGMHLLLPFGADSIVWYGLEEHEDTGSSPTLHSAPTLHLEGTAKMVRWLTLAGPDKKGIRITSDSNCIGQAALPAASSATPAGASLQLFTPVSARPTLPIHYHQVFKITPMASVMDHPARASSNR